MLYQLSVVVMTLLLCLPVSCLSQGDNWPHHIQVQRLNDSYIDVYYNTPKASEMPILIFCQGSGYDSNTAGFLSVMKQFEEQVVGLAIEKQGVNLGDSGDTLTNEYLVNNRIENRLYDYLRVLQYLRTHVEWWNGDLYIIGGSEGGLLAGMLACYYPDVKGVSIFSFGGGLNFGEAWPISIGFQKNLEGATDENVEHTVNSTKDTLQLIRQEPVFTKSYSGADNTYAWWNSIVDLRLENCLLDLSIPINIVQGGRDIMAPPISARTLDEHFMTAGKTNLYYKEYAGLDHGYSDEEGNSHLIDVITESINWILNNH